MTRAEIENAIKEQIEELSKYYDKEKLKKSVYFVDGLKYDLGEMWFDNEETLGEFTCEIEKEIIEKAFN